MSSSSVLYRSLIEREVRPWIHVYVNTLSLQVAFLITLSQLSQIWHSPCALKMTWRRRRRRRKISSFSSTSISSDYISEIATRRSLTRLSPSNLWNLILWKGKCWRCIIYVWFIEQASSQISAPNLWKWAESRNGQRWTRKRKMCNQWGTEHGFYFYTSHFNTQRSVTIFSIFNNLVLTVYCLKAVDLLFIQCPPQLLRPLVKMSKNG